MAEEAGLRAHFRRHGYVHASWVIFVLVLIIAGMMVVTPSADSLTDYISFAAAVTSLFLGAIAIFYSMISNQGFSETIGLLKSSADNVQTAAKNIAGASAMLSDQSERMIGEVARVPPAMQALSEKINETLAQKSSVLASGGTSKDSDDNILTNTSSVGGQAAIYALALGADNSKSFDPYKIFDTDTWSNFVSGFLQGVRSFSPCGIKLKYESGGGNQMYTVLSTGQFPVKDFIKMYEQFDESVEPERGLIKEYFFPSDKSLSSSVKVSRTKASKGDNSKKS